MQMGQGLLFTTFQGRRDLTDGIRPVKAHRDLKSVIMQDQSCVDASKLALGHPERY